MRIAILTIILNIFTFICYSQESVGIKFNNLTFNQALNESEKSGKMIFMDCYTSWCAPCKMMNSQVFTKKTVGDYFNSTFVNIKFDMEKGEGLELSKRYKLKAFPTFLILNSKGEEIHRLVGGYSESEFLNAIKDGMENSIFSLRKKFEAGERSKDFIIFYLDRLGKAYDFKSITPLVDTLTKRYIKEMNASDWEIIRKYTSDPLSETFSYLVNNRNEVDALFGRENVTEKLTKTLNSSIFNLVNSVVTDDKPFNKDIYTSYKNLIKNCDLAEKEYYNKSLTYMNYHNQKDVISCIELFDDYFSKESPNSRFSYTMLLNQTVYKNGCKQDIDMTIEVLKRVMKENKIPENEPMHSNVIRVLNERRNEVPKRMYANSFEGKKAPDFFVSEWVSKTPKMKGKFILIDFWATWCGPCLMSIPKLNKIHDKFKKNIVVIGVSDESKDKILSSKNLPEPMRFYSAIDPKRTMNKAYGIKAIPHVVIINPDGIVVWEGFPFLEEDPLTEELIEKLINKSEN